MSDLVRLSMTIERPLYEQMEALAAAAGVENRSQFIRDLLRRHLATRAWEAGEEVYGTLTLTYDHHRRELPARLLDLQHSGEVRILASTHLHLEHHRCLEVLIVHGRAGDLERFSQRFRQLKGVQHVALARVGPGCPPPQHEDGHHHVAAPVPFVDLKRGKARTNEG